MNILNKCWAIFGAILLFSCNGNDYEPDGSIILKVENDHNSNKKEVMNASLFVDSVRYIKLESSENSMFTGISSVYFVDDKIIVIDRLSHKVLVFSEKGKFLNQISRPGRGHNEYLGMRQCMIDEEKHQIKLLEGKNNRIIYYDFDGNFIKDITNFSEKDVIRDIIDLPNGNFLCYSFEYTQKVSEKNNFHAGLWEVDSLGRFVRYHKTYPNVYPFVINMDNGYFNRLSDDRIAIRDGYFNDIYIWENDSLTTYISYDIDRSHLFKNKNKKDKVFINEPYTMCFTSEIKGHYVFSVWGDDNQNTFYSLYDLKDSLFIVSDSIDYESDKFAAINGFCVKSNLDNVLIFSINGNNVESALNNPYVSNNTKKKLKEILEGESPDNMNCILELLYLKE